MRGWQKNDGQGTVGFTMWWAAILAMAFYGLEIAITDLELSTISPRLMTLYYSTGVATLAALSLLVNREPIVMPSSQTSMFIMLMIITSFLAATAHFYAINWGIGTARLTLIYAFLPAIGILFSILFKREIPSINLIFAWILAGLSLYLVSTAQKTVSVN